jgi:FdhD protein
MTGRTARQRVLRVQADDGAAAGPAVELAEESGMTLVGFLRGTTMNVYTGAHWLSG